MTEISKLPKELKTDIAIDGGKLSMQASEVWDLTGAEPERLR